MLDDIEGAGVRLEAGTTVGSELTEVSLGPGVIAPGDGARPAVQRKREGSFDDGSSP